MYWAEALAKQNKDIELSDQFTTIYDLLSENESKIVEELNKVQGTAVDIKGYYEPNEEITSKAMRPSTTFNNIIE